MARANLNASKHNSVVFVIEHMDTIPDRRIVLIEDLKDTRDCFLFLAINVPTTVSRAYAGELETTKSRKSKETPYIYPCGLTRATSAYDVSPRAGLTIFASVLTRSS